MSDANSTSTEAQRLGEQEDVIDEKLKDFLTSSLRWSLALLGVKDLLINMQATFIMIFVALIVLFGIGSRIRRSSRGEAFINFMFLILGCLVVGIALDSIVSSSYIKWAIYGMFLAGVTANPDYQQFFQEMKRIIEPISGATYLRLRNLFIQSHVFIEILLRLNVANQEESSMNNNLATRPVGGDGIGVGEDIV